MSDSQSVTDFSRSFLRFRMDLTQTSPQTVSQPPPFTLNNARFPIECVCRVRWAGKGPTQQYVLGAACKAEQVHVPAGIWHDPPADMCLVASDEEFLVIKSWDRNHRGVMLDPPSLGEQPERQAGKNAAAFTEMRIDRVSATGRPLDLTAEIVDAVLANERIVSQTDYTLPDGTSVQLEYPVKVVNVSEREMFYQVDTGPILLPDETAYDGTHDISRLRLAFIAHNTLGCTEALMNVPTPISDAISVNHYSQPVLLTASHRMLTLDAHR